MMAQTTITMNDEIKKIQIKSYGSLTITGTDTDTIVSNSSNTETTTLVQSGPIVYLTAMSACQVSLPKDLEVLIEKGMGSVDCVNLQAPLYCEKILGKLIADTSQKLTVEKIGGDCALRNFEASIDINKIGGNLIVDKFSDLRVDKLGGNCYLKNSTGQIQIGKIGGNLTTDEGIGSLLVDKVGGDCDCQNLAFGAQISVGGDVKTNLQGELKSTSIKAGGDVKIFIPSGLTDLHYAFECDGDIHLVLNGMEEKIEEGVLDKTVGEPQYTLEIKCGGDIHVTDQPYEIQNNLGDLSKYFSKSELNINDLIHERVRQATEMASKRIETAQNRLQAKLQGKFDDIKIPPIEIPHIEIPPIVIPPIPDLPGLQPKPKKQAATSDEERLLILQMLQDKKITVEEAENLFKAIEK
jgi:hypothetical protein